MPGSTTTRGQRASRASDAYHVAFCWSGEHRHPEFVLRCSILGLLIPLSMLRDDPRRSPRMTRGRCGPLRLALRRTSTVYLLRVYPAHPDHPISRRWMFGRVFGLEGRESYRELRLEPLCWPSPSKPRNCSA
jgi:hypothetical protein